VNYLDTNTGITVSYPTTLSAGLATDGTHLFWIDSANNVIGRSNLDGADNKDQFITVPSNDSVLSLATEGGYLYWGENNAGIGRAGTTGHGVNQRFVRTPGGVCALGVRLGYIYFEWAANIGLNGGIGRVSTTGRGLRAHLDRGGISGVCPTTIAVDGR